MVAVWTPAEVGALLRKPLPSFLRAPRVACPHPPVTAPDMQTLSPETQHCAALLLPGGGTQTEGQRGGGRAPVPRVL